VGNRVKIGAGAMILGNIPIEDGVVIGAAAIVTVPVKTVRAPRVPLSALEASGLHGAGALTMVSCARVQGETVVGINRILSPSQKRLAAESSKDMETWLYTI